MTAKTSRTRKNSGRNGALEVPLRNHAERALSDYFSNLNGHKPAHLYDMVLREVEAPLFRAVLDYSAANQCRAAAILGINRGTLRKKMRQFGLSAWTPFPAIDPAAARHRSPGPFFQRH